MLAGIDAGFFVIGNDEQRAQAKIQEIMSRNRMMQLPEPIKMALLDGMNYLAATESSSWRFFDWFARNMSELLIAFEQQMGNADPAFQEYIRNLGPIDMQNPPEIDMAMVPMDLVEVNAKAEELISLTENLTTIFKNLPPQGQRPNIDGMSIDQVRNWVNENARYIKSSKWVEYNPVYSYENGWEVIHLTHDKDFKRAGKELGNCIRHSPPPEGGGFRGHPGIFVIVDENQNPLVSMRMGERSGQGMYVCFDAKAFEPPSAGGRGQVDAETYKEYINEFLRNTNPTDVYGEQYDQYNEWQAAPAWLSKIVRVSRLISLRS